MLPDLGKQDCVTNLPVRNRNSAFEVLHFTTVIKGAQTPTPKLRRASRLYSKYQPEREGEIRVLKHVALVVHAREETRCCKYGR